MPKEKRDRAAKKNTPYTEFLALSDQEVEQETQLKPNRNKIKKTASNGNAEKFSFFPYFDPNSNNPILSERNPQIFNAIIELLTEDATDDAEQLKKLEHDISLLQELMTSFEKKHNYNTEWNTTIKSQLLKESLFMEKEENSGLSFNYQLPGKPGTALLPKISIDSFKSLTLYQMRSIVHLCGVALTQRTQNNITPITATEINQRIIKTRDSIPTLTSQMPRDNPDTLRQKEKDSDEIQRRDEQLELQRRKILQ